MDGALTNKHQLELETPFSTFKAFMGRLLGARIFMETQN